MANKKDLATGLIGTALTTSATSLVLQTGYGAAMPATPFFLTLTPVGQLSTLGNSEIVSVTARSGDTLTIVRAQKGTTAKAFAVGDIAANGIYVSDAAVGSVRLSASRTTAFALTATAWTTFPHDTVSENTGGGSFSGGIFTIPVSGLYICTASVRLVDNAAAQSFGQGIDTVNGDSPTTLWSNLGGEQRSARAITKVAYFNAGDQVRHYYYASSSVNTNTNGNSFSVTLLRQD